MSKLLFVIFGTLLVSALAQPLVGVQCGTFKCIAGEQCCGDASSTMAGFTSLPSSGGTDMGTTMDTMNNTMEAVLLCFNPNTHSCVNGSLCPLGQERCGDACFDASQYTCGTDNFGNNLLCGMGMNICGTGCYDSASYR